jgi:hypothetical protein
MLVGVVQMLMLVLVLVLLSALVALAGAVFVAERRSPEMFTLSEMAFPV